ncbi:MAG: hypothetical protein ACI8RZ_002607 [Myxococcota bacterium]|jgi:hypothetical protein
MKTAALMVLAAGCTPVTPHQPRISADTAQLDTVEPARTRIDREALEDGLVGMWLGASVGAWTGQQTEGLYTAPPFLTDADRSLVSLATERPWQATHEMDLEYLYLSLLWESGDVTLSEEAIGEAWLTHLSGDPSPSAGAVLTLLDEGLSPSATGLGAVNGYAWLADAQREVEVLGALAPGRPDLALALADVPIRTTADGYAIHAAQFLVVMHALAPVAPADEPAEQLRWLVEQARGVVPDTSKTADVIDTVLTLSEQETWEESRDAVFRRYQRDPESIGYAYQGWRESSINLAATLIALLHGEGDPARTIEIAALCGWESDTSAATAGSLLGLLIGAEALKASLGGDLTEHYQSQSTLLGMPDYLPDSDASDTFSLMARRTLPVIDAILKQADAVPTEGGWLVEIWDEPSEDLLEVSPTWLRHTGSARQRVEDAGGLAVVVSSVLGSSPPSGTGNPEVLINGSEQDSAGLEPVLISPDGACLLPTARRACFSTEGTPADTATLTVRYDRPVTINEVVFWEGYHATDAAIGGAGGWLIAPEVTVEIDGSWVLVSDGPWPEPSEAPFQVLAWQLPEQAEITGIRLKGSVEGFITGLELDGFLSASQEPL